MTFLHAALPAPSEMPTPADRLTENLVTLATAVGLMFVVALVAALIASRLRKRRVDRALSDLSGLGSLTGDTSVRDDGWWAETAKEVPQWTSVAATPPAPSGQERPTRSLRPRLMRGVATEPAEATETLEDTQEAPAIPEPVAAPVAPQPVAAAPTAAVPPPPSDDLTAQWRTVDDDEPMEFVNLPGTASTSSDDGWLRD